MENWNLYMTVSMHSDEATDKTPDNIPQIVVDDEHVNRLEQALERSIDMLQANANLIKQMTATNLELQTEKSSEQTFVHNPLSAVDLSRTYSTAGLRRVGFSDNIQKPLKVNRRFQDIQRNESTFHLDYEGYREYDHRVTVEFKVTFLKINDIDTLSQQFEAEIFVQARWEEHAFLGMEPEEVQCLLPGDLWDPLLNIVNVTGDFDHERRSYVVRYEEGYEAPVVLHRWRFKGLFKELMMLRHFPFDVQDLSLQISTERSVDEILMKHDPSQLSSVNTRSFQSDNEWKLYKHVECTHRTTTVEYASSTIHPILMFQCRVRRKVWYFIWNIVLIALLVMVLSFLTMNVDPSGGQRLSNTITLFLTMVAFKLVVKQSLPTISYLTYLDMYVLGSLIYLVLFAIENSAMMSMHSRKMDAGLLSDYDTLFCMILGAIFIFWHLVFIIHIQITALKRQRKMKENDRQYELTAQELAQRHPQKQKASNKQPYP